MTTIQQIQNKQLELKVLNSQLSRDRLKLEMQFLNKINNLISSTPTGDLRNDLTDLNILFQALIETI